MFDRENDQTHEDLCFQDDRGGQGSPAVILMGAIVAILVAFASGMLMSLPWPFLLLLSWVSGFIGVAVGAALNYRASLAHEAWLARSRDS